MKLTNTTRRRLYDTALAIAAVAVLYGLLSEDQAAALVAVLAPWLLLARVKVEKDETPPVT